VTFGCRVNQADSLAIESDLCARGGAATSPDRADLVVVNTCSVTASADQGARQTIRRIARDNPAARIVVTGCYATRCSEDVAALPGVAEVVPNDRKLTIPLLNHADLTDGPCGRALAPGLMGRTCWTLRVQTGCEERCSYCIIPATRGASRSRTLADIQLEVSRVVEAGYKEIAITGVHLGSYGRDLSPRWSLIELLAALCEGRDGGRAFSAAEASAKAASPAAHAAGDILFRISSLEPMDFPRALLDLPVAPHFHLPLQHASPRMLQAMRRPYSIEDYADLVGDIRARLPHAAIGSDLIAGFPGETDADFEALTTYLETSPLTHLHVFPYSDRPGTVASGLPGKVHGSAIKARAHRLREISRTLADRFRAAQRGTTRPALTIDDGSVAVTDNYVRVPVAGPHARNEWVFAEL
jgi:threonylcarbamoyladenosine tRNA methylthiotransferase MtaB